MEEVPQIPTPKTTLIIKSTNFRETRVFTKYKEAIQGNPKHIFFVVIN